MKDEYQCLKKDKRLLVLFAFGALILSSEILFSANVALPRYMHSAWFEVQGEKVFRYLGIEQNTGQSIKKLQTLMNSDDESLFAPDRVCTSSNERTTVSALTETGEMTSAVSPKLLFLLGMPIPINKAEAGDLALIQGVGPALSGKIIAFRDVHGPFQHSDQLLQVNGIGIKTQKK